MSDQLNNQEYRRLFKAAPAMMVVLKPHSYEIVAVTDAYLEATKTREIDIAGKSLFEVFPHAPSEPDTDDVIHLKESFNRVESLKAPDVMGIQRYLIKGPDGGIDERFWCPVNSPILDDGGNIEFIVHRVEDVTAVVRRSANWKKTGDLEESSEQITFENIILQSQELAQALSKLQEYEARIRTAKRMLKLGTWEADLEEESLHWSAEVFDIYGLSADRGAPDYESYEALLHPNDRAATLAAYNAFYEQGEHRLEFEHRVIGSDGSIKFVKGVGERHNSSGREMLVGFVQDITELVGIRHKLDQAQQLLRLAGDKVRLGGWRVELDTETVIWTPETAMIHGLPANYSPQSVAEAISFYAPEYREVVQNTFAQCARDGVAFDIICQLQTADGQLLWVRSIGAPERDERGEVFAVQGAFQDITALRAAETKAVEAEHQRISVLESISDAFFTIDNNWKFTYLNTQAHILLDRENEKLIGLNIWDEFPEFIDTDFYREYRYATRNRQTRQFQEFHASTGKWFDVSAYPIPDGLAVYFRDVTTEREHQHQLRIANAALSRQNDIVIITEATPLDAPTGPKIIYVNDAFERLTGYSRNEAIGQTPRILQGPDTDRKQLDRIRQCIENEKPIRCEVLNYTKGGETYWLELDITPLFDSEGHCSHFVAVERDITERKEMEKRLQEAQKLEAVGHLTGGVAHDFNNLLTVILGNAEILAEVITDPKLRPMAEMTVSAAERGAQLTSRLLAFARRQPLDPKPMDINHLVESMWPLIRRTLPENIDLQFKPDPDLGTVELDASGLDTALLNLVVNARDAIHRSGKLTIETANVQLDKDYADRHVEIVTGEYVMVCVSDTGKGMNRETVQRAFEPFFTTKEVGKGSGLGLSMVFGFTKQSNGHIKIYSEPGEGTSVKLYFPRTPSMKKTGPDSPPEILPQGNMEHILIAEDDNLVLQNLENQLLSLGYRVTKAMSGPEALDILRATDDIDLLLTDIVMPGGMNGRELAEQAQSAQPSLKVIYSSGYTENAIVHHGRLDPGVILLSKPYTRSQLASKLRAALENNH